MSLVDTVSNAMKEALKAKDTLRLQALRSIRAAFLNEMKKGPVATLLVSGRTTMLHHPPPLPVATNACGVLIFSRHGDLQS